MQTNQERANHLHFILTGGTIDSRYDPDQCTVVPHHRSVIPQYLRETIGLKEDETVFSEVCMKDSRDLNQKDVDAIQTIIETSSARRFIITHGTYTLSKTAAYLKAHIKRKHVTVIVTGAMIPLAGFWPSDAAFNLGFAVAQADNSPPGFFVCISGKLMRPDQVPDLHH